MDSPAAKISTISFILVCGTAVFTVLAYGTVHQPIIAFFYLMVTVLILLWAAGSALTGTFRFSRSSLQLPLLLLGLYAFIQVIPFGYTDDPDIGRKIERTISLDPFATQATAIHIIFLCLFFAVLLASIDRPSRLRKITVGLTAFGFMYAFYAIIQSVLSPDQIYGIYEPAYARPFGSFVNRHNFAAIIEMTIALPLGLLFAGAVKKDQRLLYWIAIALMATALLLSGSRGGLVALLAGLVFLAILTIMRKGRSQIFLSISLAVALAAIALAGAVFVGGDTSLTRFSDSAAGANISSSRSNIWATSIRVIAAHLPLGAGLGAFPQAYTRFDTLGGGQSVEQAHNDYLQVLADAGIVGGLLGAWFLYLLLREGFRNVRSRDNYRRGVAMGAFAGCLAILVHSLFDFVLHITAVSVMFMTLMAFLVASGRRFEEDDTALNRRSAPVSELRGARRRSVLRQPDPLATMSETGPENESPTK